MEELEKKIQDLNSELSILKSKKDDLLNSINSEEKNLAILASKKENIIKNTLELEQIQNALEDKIKAEKENLSNVSLEISKKREEIAELNKSIEKSREYLKSFSKDIEELKKTNDKITNDFLLKKDDLMNDIKKLELEKSKLKDELEKNNKEFKEHIKSSIEFKDLATSRNSLLKKDLEFLESEISSKNENLLNLKSSIEKINYEKDKLEIGLKSFALEKASKFEELKNLGISYEIMIGKVKEEEKKYNELLKKTTVILSKEEHLKLYENYLREHYEKVGLQYTEFQK